MSRVSIRLALALALGASALGGCGPTYQSAFSYHFADNDETTLSAVLEQLPEPSQDDRPENALARPIAVVTTHAEDDAARQVVAFDVETGATLWSASLDAATQPEILGDVVLTSTREELVAYDLRDGRELYRRGLPDLAYVGATRDGDVIYWSATVGALGGARRVGHVVAMNARSGEPLWRHEIEGVFGQPAAAAGLVFVPWERQNIAILDEATGNELARLRSTDDVIAWAFDHPTGIYYGGRGIYRLTHRSVHGTRAEATHVRPALGELPRQPDSIWPDGYVPRPGTRSARGRIRVYFNPAPAPDAESIHVEGDTYYFVYYRYVIAYDLEGNLRWTRILEQDVANAEAMPHGLLTVGEQGHVRLLDRDTGNDRFQRDVDLSIASVALDASGFDPAGEAGEVRPLRQSLNELVLDPDNRLVAARAYAIAQLARIEEPEITRDLLDLYQQRSMPGALKEAIREALRTRRSGQEFLMAALERRYDYLEDTQAPPLEAIVPALLEMEHREAVPRLVNHMMDHETPPAVLPLVVRAVVALGGAEAVPALRTFLVLYHADSEFEGPVADQPAEEGRAAVPADPEAQALALAAAGIFEHGGEEGRALLSSLAGEGARTHEPIAAHIQGLYQAETDAAARAAREEELAAQRALATAAAEAEAALPRQLSQEQINQTFAENADAIRECVAGELERTPLLTQVRMVFILTSEGDTSELTVSPSSEELTACLRERVAQIDFPRFRQRMMRASFVVSIRGAEGHAEDTQPAIAPLPADAPWWAWSQRRAELRGAAAVPALSAWWTERDAPAPRPSATPAVEEDELPPGMAEAIARQRQAQEAQPSGTQPSGTQPSGTQPSGTQPSGTQPSGTQPSGGGTPWWAATGADDEEPEEEEEDDADQKGAPLPRAPTRTGETRGAKDRRSGV